MEKCVELIELTNPLQSPRRPLAIPARLVPFTVCRVTAAYIRRRSEHYCSSCTFPRPPHPSRLLLPGRFGGKRAIFTFSVRNGTRFENRVKSVPMFHRPSSVLLLTTPSVNIAENARSLRPDCSATQYYCFGTFFLCSNVKFISVGGSMEYSSQEGATRTTGFDHLRHVVYSIHTPRV
jgi:hypothetical protein